MDIRGTNPSSESTRRVGLGVGWLDRTVGPEDDVRGGHEAAGKAPGPKPWRTVDQRRVGRRRGETMTGGLDLSDPPVPPGAPPIRPDPDQPPPIEEPPPPIPVPPEAPPPPIIEPPPPIVAGGTWPRMIRVSSAQGAGRMFGILMGEGD
jgi:hypothetical protein